VFETQALYQNDPRWKDVKLGNQNKETIGSWGCLMTSMTMVANGFGNEETPETINEKMKGAGGFQGALIVPAVLSSVVSGLVFKGYQSCEDSPAPLAQIDAAIARNQPVIAQVDWSPNAGLQTHWVVLYDKEDDHYLMKDPYRYRGDAPDKPLFLTDRYKFSGKDPANAITGVIWFEESAAPATPPKPKEKIQVPADSLSVYSTADGLAFRAEPSVAGYLIKRIPLAGEMKTLIGKAQAQPKVGVQGQWLQVEEVAEGKQGYVAAWYVVMDKDTALKGDEEPASTPAPKPKPAPVTGTPAVSLPLIVEPTTDGVAFRTQPVVTDGTLIGRAPLGTVFTVVESLTEANKKLGIYGQWLKVKDSSNKEGYVAAWYVKHSAESPRPSAAVEVEAPATTTTGGQLVLQTTTEGVAFRSKPTVVGDTLIKRLPDASTLYALDSDAASKVGQYNQWLRVRDTTNKEGYVAAWYVRKGA
jgi:hypothetical protein